MCSWCYAFDEVLKNIELSLPDSIILKKMVGGLAADSKIPMPDSLKQSIQMAWSQIEQTVPGIQFNHDFWALNTPFRSTYPACRAVIAAKKQGEHFERKMIDQIQTAYYKDAQNPSLDETLISSAVEVGLNAEVFKLDYKSEGVELELQSEIKFARELGVSSFPSLLLVNKGQILSIIINYVDAQKILNQIFSRI